MADLVCQPDILGRGTLTEKLAYGHFLDGYIDGGGSIPL